MAQTILSAVSALLATLFAQAFTNYPGCEIHSIQGSFGIQLRCRKRPKYKLADLLAQCDYTIPMSAEEREWLDMPSVGREIVD